MSVALVACQAHVVELTLLDECASEGDFSYRDAAVYAEVLAFADACPPDAELRAGIVDGATARAVGSPDAPPGLGALRPGRYGFAVLLRDEHCGVIGFGCTDGDGQGVDPRETRRVNIHVGAFGNPAGFCTPFSGGGCAVGQCSAGSCLTDVDVSPDACELGVVATGALPAPLATPVQVLGPSVAATPGGFVVGYREYDLDAGRAQVSILPVSAAGEVGAPVRQGPEAVCAAPRAGVGLAFDATTGVLIASDADCDDADPDGAGARLLALEASADGLVTLAGTGRVVTTEPAAFSALELPAVHAVGRDPRRAGDFLVAYRAVPRGAPSAAALEVGVLRGARFKADTRPVRVFGGEPAAFAAVATSSAAIAVLGGFEASVRLLVGEPGDGLPPPHSIELGAGAAAGASVFAWGGRVVGVVPTPSGIEWTVVTATGTEVASGSVAGRPVRATDVAVSGDHLIVVGGERGALMLHRIDGAAGVLDVAVSATRALTPAADASLEGFSGERLSLAAGHDRVLVAWVSQQRLAPTAPVGGWALLRCGAAAAGGAGGGGGS